MYYIVGISAGLLLFWLGMPWVFCCCILLCRPLWIEWEPEAYSDATKQLEIKIQDFDREISSLVPGGVVRVKVNLKKLKTVTTRAVEAKS